MDGKAWGGDCALGTIPAARCGNSRENRRYWIGNSREIRKAIRAFKPVVVHAHPMFIAEMVAGEVERSGLPLTARGHVGFGGQEKEDLKAIRGFASRRVVSRNLGFSTYSCGYRAS